MGKCLSKNFFEGLVLDFDAPPMAGEEALYEEAKEFLLEAADIVERIESYSSSAALSRKALAEPTAENRWCALESVSQNALEIYHFWKFSQRCAEMLTKFLSTLVSTVGDDQLTDPSDQLELSSRSALIRQFAEIMAAVIRFDRGKALAASIQNDLSFYRRVIQSVYQPQSSLQSKSETDQICEQKLLTWEQPAELSDTIVSTLSFFIASPVPVMQVICKEIAKLTDQNEHVSLLLPFVPNMFSHLIRKKSLPADSEYNYLCLQAMVGFIIVTDRVEPEGAYHSHSYVKINHAISVLEDFHKNHPALDKEEQVFQLVDCLKYWSIHLQDDTTPSKIAWRLMM